MDVDGFILDMEDLIDYVHKKTGIDKEALENVFDCEHQYMVEKGIAEITEI